MGRATRRRDGVQARPGERKGNGNGPVALGGMVLRRRRAGGAGCRSGDEGQRLRIASDRAG
ncbi:hypothetical protein [Paraburkholderia sp. BCC1885]|uniref:hypothetical protein n=1 Tax=Paraburkholderia sp. BCC1885 TaxID=2562669 RepID=UPI0011830017|nr:hypothetical protein [Paraburkholderia sp. BCC1885]